jgi:outer membrane biosynthesis protein TonB
MAFPRRPNTVGLLKTSGVSLGLHIAMVVLLSLNPLPTIIKVHPTAYTVTLIPISLREPEIQKTDSVPAPKEESPKPIEKMKPIEKPKKEDIVEKIKKPQKEKESLKHLQEAIEEIRKKAALDEIQKRVAGRERREERPTVISPNVPLISSIKTSPGLDSKLNEYYSMIWAKIKEAWTIPENLLKETVDLETIIVLIIGRDGKIQKWWFEKKSGNALYDQMAMRAIKKAEPLPPIPKEFSENTLEIGIRFIPE